MVATGLEWFMTHTGAAATTHLEAGAFLRSQPGVEHPDTQYHFLPSVVINHGSQLGHCHAFQVLYSFPLYTHVFFFLFVN